MARAKAKKAKSTVKPKAKPASKARAPKKSAAKTSSKRAVRTSPPKKASKPSAKSAAKKPARKSTPARSATKKTTQSKPGRKSAAKKPATKKVVARKPAAKKPATKKVVAKKRAAKKVVAKKPTSKKSIGKTGRKAAVKPAKKAVTKKAVARKAQSKAAKKPVARKTAGKAARKQAATSRKVDKAPKSARKKPVAVAPGGEKKKAGIAEVKAAAVRTRKKVSKRGRKRQRVTPTSTPLANWIPKDGLRPSSFLPAPPRAQSAFTVAAAPASSDRLIRDEDLAPPAPIRTIPVLVHVVQESGRIQIRTNPSVVEAAPGDAVEWDFRYFGGADVLVTQVAIDISRPSPFGKSSYKSAKPGSARPHRCVSDIVKDKALNTTAEYSIHCTNAFKTELARGAATIVIREAEPTDAAH